MAEDLRNKYNVNAPRCRGGYVEEVPPSIWGDPDWCLEPKMDGDRVTMEIGDGCSLLIGRNRQDQLKGVKAAGAFRDLSYLNPNIAGISFPALTGTVLDGELTETYTSSGELDANTAKRAAAGEFLGYTVWGVLFVKGMDVRHMPESARRTMAEEIVARLNYPKIRMIERVPCTKENLEKFFARNAEGAVAKKLSAGIPLTQRTNTFWFKIKGDDKRTVDAFISGVTEGKTGGSGVRGIKAQPNGKAASFTMSMMDGGKAREVCKLKHLPDVAAEKGLQQFHKFKDKVVEMRVSGWNGKEFRWPKWVKLRLDKSPADCRLEEQLGKEKAWRSS